VQPAALPSGGSIQLLATLRGRITTAVVLLVLLACALVAGGSLNIAEREMRATIGAQQFDLLSAAAAYLDADISQKQTLLRTVAEGFDITLPCSQAQGVLKQYQALNDQFANVVAFDDTGLLAADLHDSRLIGAQRFHTRPYFEDTMRKRAGVLSEPFISVLSNAPVILITEPVLDRQGKIFCILGGSINLEQAAFFGQITRLSPGQTGYLYAITKDGLILHHPNKNRLLKNVLTEPGTPVPSTVAAMHGWEGWVVARTKIGIPALLTYKRMRHPEWILGAVYPAEEAFHSVRKGRRTAWIYAAFVALLAGFAGWYVTREILRPLFALKANVSDVESGQLAIEAFDLQRQDEVGELGRALYSLSAKWKAAEARLADLARVDPLTGLGNRRCLEEEAVHAIERAQRLQHSLALAFLDIDHFKDINDSLGHETGDGVLKEFGARLKAAIRASDNVYRLAGDEFVIVFENVESGAATEHLAGKILKEVRRPFTLPGNTINVTASIGVVLCGWEGSDLATLLRRADEALYDTKRRGRDGYTMVLHRC
jgi:diguanylate cyclase (GGDEF)-like protein